MTWKPLDSEARRRSICLVRYKHKGRWVYRLAFWQSTGVPGGRWLEVHTRGHITPADYMDNLALEEEMPKTITVIKETDGYDDHEVWECAYSSLEDAKRDAIEHLEDMRRQEPGAWSSLSYTETGSAFSRSGAYTMAKYGGSQVVLLRLIPLTLT